MKKYVKKRKRLCFNIQVISTLRIVSFDCCFSGTVVCDQLNLEDGLIQQTEGNRAGSVATHTCNSGFSLSGDMERTCQSNGVWTGAVASCTPSESYNNTGIITIHSQQ